jgi:hypothetical protein
MKTKPWKSRIYKPRLSRSTWEAVQAAPRTHFFTAEQHAKTHIADKGWDVSPAAGRGSTLPCSRKERRRRPRRWNPDVAPATEEDTHDLGIGKGRRHHLILPAITRLNNILYCRKHKNVMPWVDKILHGTITPWRSYFQILGAWSFLYDS